MKVGTEVQLEETSPRNWNKAWWDKLNGQFGKIEQVKQMSGDRHLSYLVRMNKGELRSWWLVAEEFHMSW